MCVCSNNYNEVKIAESKIGETSVKIDDKIEITHPISYKLDTDPDNQRVKVTLEFYANVDIRLDVKAHNTTSTKSQW